MTKITVNRTYEISDEILRNTVLDGYMLSHAIGYWAVDDEHDPEARTLRVEWYEREGDPDSKTEKTITYEDIAWAMAELAFGERELDVHRHYRNTVAGFFRELDDPVEQYPGGDIDSEVGDIIIQVAVLGNVIYG